MTTPLTSAELRTAAQLLSSPPLIRLIAEIDDNGAIPPRMLAATLSDLSAHRLRRAAEAARAHGLVRVVPGVGLDLTASGARLADFYDATARWDRRRSGPSPVCDFTSRIQRTLAILTPALVAESADVAHRPAVANPPAARAEADLVRRLVQWLASSPQVTQPEPAA